VEKKRCLLCCLVSGCGDVEEGRGEERRGGKENEGEGSREEREEGKRRGGRIGLARLG